MWGPKILVEVMGEAVTSLDVVSHSGGAMESSRQPCERGGEDIRNGVVNG